MHASTPILLAALLALAGCDTRRRPDVTGANLSPTVRFGADRRAQQFYLSGYNHTNSIISLDGPAYQSARIGLSKSFIYLQLVGPSNELNWFTVDLETGELKQLDAPPADPPEQMKTLREFVRPYEKW